MFSNCLPIVNSKSQIIKQIKILKSACYINTTLACGLMRLPR
jgi:hypothetical protein